MMGMMMRGGRRRKCEYKVFFVSNLHADNDLTGLAKARQLYQTQTTSRGLDWGYDSYFSLCTMIFAWYSCLDCCLFYNSPHLDRLQSGQRKEWGICAASDSNS